jgi:hypothetical protein
MSGTGHCPRPTGTEYCHTPATGTAYELWGVCVIVRLRVCCVSALKHTHAKYPSLPLFYQFPPPPSYLNVLLPTPSSILISTPHQLICAPVFVMLNISPLSLFTPCLIQVSSFPPPPTLSIPLCNSKEFVSLFTAPCFHPPLLLLYLPGTPPNLFLTHWCWIYRLLKKNCQYYNNIIPPLYCIMYIFFHGLHLEVFLG